MKKYLLIIFIVILAISIILSGVSCKKTAESSTSDINEVEITKTEAAVKDKIAFVSGKYGNREIYIMNIDGSEQTRLTDNSADDSEPCFSPDGARIAFVSDRDGNKEIYIMNVDGSEQKRLTNNPASDRHPCFSPNGIKIAFASNRDGNTEIYVMNMDGSEQTNLTNNPASDTDPRISPDGTKIVFISDRDDRDSSEHYFEIYIMNANGSEQTRFTYDSKDGKRVDSPCFSSDGTKIAFKSRASIDVMNIDGSERKIFSGIISVDSDHCLSPDWSKIAVVRGGEAGDIVSDILVFTVDAYNLDGSYEASLTKNPPSGGSPYFSP
jgi:Tol biopolymer transport system component